MRIMVNGDAREVTAETLEAIMEELGYRGSVVATAVNGWFIAASARAARILCDGDRLEVVAPMQGG